jgi:hypothetical protein
VVTLIKKENLWVLFASRLQSTLNLDCLAILAFLAILAIYTVS